MITTSPVPPNLRPPSLWSRIERRLPLLHVATTAFSCGVLVGIALMLAT